MLPDGDGNPGLAWASHLSYIKIYFSYTYIKIYLNSCLGTQLEQLSTTVDKVSDEYTDAFLARYTTGL